MEINLCSFNVLNFKFNSSGEQSFKQKKVKKIAKILREKNCHLAALQEIKSTETVAEIAKELGFEFCHCENLYDELNQENFLNRHGSSFKAEYAFLWDPNILRLERDPEIYKGISDRISKSLELFIGAIAAFIWTMIIVKMAEKKEESKLRILLKAFGIAGGTWTLATLLKNEMVKRQISAFLYQALRPPLIGIFKKNNDSVEKEIRIINTHTQFAKIPAETGTATEIRLKELEFILGEIFDIVDTQRDGKNRHATTIVAGDYNLPLRVIANLDSRPGFARCHRDRTFRTVQDLPSTITVVNQDEVKRGQQARFEYNENYDHFSYDESLFSERPAISRFSCTHDNFFIGERLISDHVPVSMTFNF